MSLTQLSPASVCLIPVCLSVCLTYCLYSLLYFKLTHTSQVFQNCILSVNQKYTCKQDKQTEKKFL